MATWAIGDVHGCARTLERLFGDLPFDHKNDRLWLVGDLVNRGPDSLGVLRWARQKEKSLGDRFVVVLGNHDLHLLALAEGVTNSSWGSMKTIRSASDSKKLIKWLRRRPFLHRQDDTVLVHAGLWPRWTLAKAERWARRLEEAFLDAPTRRLLLDARRIPQDPDLRKLARALYAFVRLRTVDSAGEACRFSGPPTLAPKGCVPWFAVPGRKSSKATIVFGHWAALGLRLEKRILGLDSGCAWGGSLTAVRLEDRCVWQCRNME